eukprot:GHVL01027496.1.p1 GENE.GHVL01027496.1~~GHVL01027496.1.p1  ORF type:complete len:495 (-),score=118.77 GHVL01027496.1:449-1900(-)
MKKNEKKNEKPSKERDHPDNYICDYGNFEEYYKNQNMSDFEYFKKFIKQPLPTVIRINTMKEFYNDIKDRLLERGWKQLEIKGLTVLQCNYDQYINDDECKNWCECENKRGSIIFQELVSMLPPIMLDLKSDQTVLDMCASPGSKSAQIVEIMQKNYKLSNPSDERPLRYSTGCVVANDIDIQRVALPLTRQIRKTGSPSAIVCSGDAITFPNLEKNNESFKFDRILCDVPCSGDGTIRKNPKIWKSWTISTSNELHLTQIAILHRGIQLLKPGGRLVYSTCSFNPIENEAVVLSALKRFKKSISINNVSNKLDLINIKYRKGWTYWKVAIKPKKNIYSDIKNEENKSIYINSQGKRPADVLIEDSKLDIEDSKLDIEDSKLDIEDSKLDIEGGKICGGLLNWVDRYDVETAPNGIHESMFDPTYSTHDDRDWYNEELKKCVRLVPQDNDSGGFFFAVITKIYEKNEKIYEKDEKIYEKNEKK